MDYKKLYEEAVNKIKSIIADKKKQGLTNCLFEGDLNEIFPELKESEGEKIRKKIVELVKKHAVNAERCQMEDWLEKQSEPKWSEEDEKMLGKCIDAASGYYSPQDKESMKDWLKSLKPQPQWKPTDEQLSVLYWVITNIQLEEEDEETLQALYKLLKKL